MTIDRILVAAAFLAALGAGLLGWLWLAEHLATRVARRWGVRARRAVLGWLWLTPALALVGTFLAWPLLNTTWLSLHDANSQHWAGLRNYAYLVEDPQVRSALRNNLLWLVLLTLVCLAVGLAVATLADGVRSGAVARAAVVLPTAVPFVAGAVIWRFMYQYQPPGLPQIGTVNAVWTGLGGEPVAWLVQRSTNNAALITVGVWMTAGFATVIIAAALTSLPPELREAATVDGATPWQVFRHVTLPHLRPTLVVTATLLAVTAFKAFDIVYVMTNGNFDTDVIANVLYRQLFVFQDNGRASAIAVLLALLSVPVLILNARSMTRSAGEGR